jgi:hypothetical protein
MSTEGNGVETAKDAKGREYYHGGVPGLRVGQMILPPTVTGARSTAEFGAAGVCRRDRVYVTSQPAVAVVFAAGYPSKPGVVYRVRPIGELRLDPDYHGRPGDSLECERAEVLQVIQLKGATRKKALRALLGKVVA